MKHRGEYPSNWPEIAHRRKTEEGWKCERCSEKDGPSPNRLTVHHLDGDKSNCADWNLAVLCQRCHLKVQGRVDMDQLIFDFRVSSWFRKHYNGWLEASGMPPRDLNEAEHVRWLQAEKRRKAIKEM